MLGFADSAQPTFRKMRRGTTMSIANQKITPFLWFDTQAEAAVNFYVNVFPNSRITNTLRNGDAGPGPKGSVLTIGFDLEGQSFVALNGGPNFKLSPAVSFVVNCRNQEEVDYYWE